MILINGCNYLNRKPDEYFLRSKVKLENLRELIRGKDKLSFIDRATHLSFIHKLFNQKEIKYKIENYKSDLQIEFELTKNFQDEIQELKKIVFNDLAKSEINDKLISLDSALSFIDITKSDIVIIFQSMKENDITYISRFMEDDNSIYFRIDDSFFLIYSKNISKLNLERKIIPEKLQDNWYYYKGII